MRRFARTHSRKLKRWQLWGIGGADEQLCLSYRPQVFVAPESP